MEREANLFRWRPALIPYIIVIISLCKQVQKLMDLHRIWWIALSIATSLGKASLKFSSSDLGTYFVIDLNMGKMLRIVWECKEWFDSSPINPQAHSTFFPDCCTWTIMCICQADHTQCVWSNNKMIRLILFSRLTMGRCEQSSQLNICFYVLAN